MTTLDKDAMTTLSSPPRYESLSRLSTSSPPPYSTAASTSFTPTLNLHISTPGKPWLSLPLPPRPDPIPIYTLPSSSPHPTPRYLSLRQTRSSGSCHLTSPDSPNLLSTTTYRFGCNRPPVVRLYLPGTGPDVSPSPGTGGSGSSPGTSSGSGGDTDEEVDLSVWDTFPLHTPTLTRTTTFTTRLGTFSWRYGSRAERKSVPCDSLLIMERITRVSGARNLGVQDGAEARTVARLVRGEGTRSAGSGKSSAGNGGLLEMESSSLLEGGMSPEVGDQKGGDEKEGREREEQEREMMTVLVVTTALVMLKKEVDRRRAAQIALMVGGASGGP